MKTTLESVSAEFADCINRTAPEDPAGEYFAVGTPAMRGNVVNFGEARRISDETFAQWTRRLMPVEGDLLIAREAPVGPVVRIPAGGNIAAGQRTTHIRPDPNKVDPRFLYYYLISPETQRRLEALSIGSTVPHLRVGDVRDFELTNLPSVSAQRAIGEVLGALDDKIAANRRVMAVADELIRSAYETLDSDPIIRLADIAENRRDLAQPKDLTVSEKYVSLDDFDRRCIWIQRAKRGDEATSAKSIFAHGDTLFGKLRPYFHKVAIANGAGVCSTDVLVIRAKTVEDQWLVAAAASSDTAVDLAVRTSNGTRMPRADWKELSSLHVPNPRSVAARKFAAVASAVGGRVWAAIEEVESLKAARDELLPLLMSGRITVKDAERAAEDVL